MATSEVHNVQMALHTCQKHENEELDLYCKTCGKLLCADCVRESHVNHKWLVLKKYASELRALAPLKVRDVARQIDSITEGHGTIFEHLKEEFEREISRNGTILEGARTTLHRIVDEIIDKRKDKLQRYSNDKGEQLESFSSRITSELQRARQLLDQLREEADTLSNFDIVELYDDIEKSLLNLFTLSELPNDCRYKITVTLCKIKKNALDNVLCDIPKRYKITENINISLKKEIDLGKGEQGHSIPISDDRLWVRHNDKLKLINMDGKEFAALDPKSNTRNFASTNTGDLLFCNERDMSVNLIGENGDMKVQFSTSPLIPVFLTVTYSSDILLSLIDEDKYSRTDKSRRQLRRVTMEGETIKEYEYDSDGTTPLFTIPGRSVEHYNGNIAVINAFLDDKVGKHAGTVLGMNYSGKVRFNYRGIGDRSLFSPIGLCCDMMGNTLISEYRNRRIHLIDHQGHFVMLLLSEQTLNIKPLSISLHNRKLYVGTYYGDRLNVYDYMD